MVRSQWVATGTDGASFGQFGGGGGSVSSRTGSGSGSCGDCAVFGPELACFRRFNAPKHHWLGECDRSPCLRRMARLNVQNAKQTGSVKAIGHASASVVPLDATIALNCTQRNTINRIGRLVLCDFGQRLSILGAPGPPPRHSTRQLRPV